MIIGSVAVDTVRTPTQAASDQLGGSASFASLVAKEYCDTMLLSAIGPDFPASLIERLQANNIATDKLTRTTEGKTFRWEGIYNEDLGTRESVGFELGVMATATIETPENIGEINYAMMGCYDPAREMEVVNKLAEDCFIATDTIEGYITSPDYHKALGELYSKTSLITVDENELKLYTNKTDETEAVQAIFEQSAKVRYVIVKYGANGSQLYAKDGQTRRVGIFTTSPKDTTGAGDTFLGAIMAHLCATQKTDIDTVAEGMRLGAAAASITIEAFGIDALEKATKIDIETRAQKLSQPATA